MTSGETPVDRAVRGIAARASGLSGLLLPSPQPAFAFAASGGYGGMGGGNVTIYQTFGPSSVRSREDIRDIGRETAERARLLGSPISPRS
jgi:hypothetical protein